MSTNADTEPKWQTEAAQWARSTASSMDDLADAGVRKLRKRFGWAGKPKIQAYTGYATQEHYRLHGRVLTNPPLTPNYKTDTWWDNLTDTVRRFASDEVPGATVSASLAGQCGEATSDSEGYFRIDLPLDESYAASVNQITWHPARIAVMKDDLPVTSSMAYCDVMQVPQNAEYLVISDIDDTIIHTSATEIGTMARLVLFGNARTRVPLRGSASLYDHLQRGSTAENSVPINPIFYVSSSPWNLYDMLEDFLELNSIPRGPMLLRDLGIDADKFIKSNHDHKLLKSEQILDQYPDMPAVLIGDSGQEDARLYATAAEKYGQRIKAIFIRDVDPEAASSHDDRVQPYLTKCQSLGVPMHLVRDSLDIAKLAAEYGLLSPSQVDSITDSTKLKS